jgi:hypothetical protein
MVPKMEDDKGSCHTARTIDRGGEHHEARFLFWFKERKSQAVISYQIDSIIIMPAETGSSVGES